MKHLIKRGFALLLCLALCVGVMGLPASATSDSAYAIFDSDNSTLIFFRSSGIPSSITYNGVTYSGTVYSGIEASSYNYNSVPWYSNRGSIVTVIFADTIAPVNTTYWFYNCYALTSIEGIELLDTSNVVSMYGMFGSCNKLTSLDVTGFDTRKVTNMQDMFASCYALTELDVSGFQTDRVTNMRGMFMSCSKLTSLDVSGFHTENVTNMASMFWSCSGLTALDVSGFNTGKVTTMSGMFCLCSKLTAIDVSGFDTRNVTSMSQMFQSCSKLATLDVSGFDTGNVTGMGSMFYGCSALTALDVSGFDTAKVTSMNSIFNRCSGLTALDVSGFDTDNVTDMSSMFYNCSGLTKLDVSGFQTGKATSMGFVFRSCSKLASLDVSGWDTGSATDMRQMFYGCTGLTELDVGNFDTSSVTMMGAMFYGCTGLTTLDVSGFDTGNVTNMVSDFYGVFDGCTNLTELTVPAGFVSASSITSASNKPKLPSQLKAAVAEDDTVRLNVPTTDIQTVAVKTTYKQVWTITYQANGANSGTAPGVDYVVRGSSYDVSDNVGGLEKSGLLFGGWNTDRNGTGTGYAAGERIIPVSNLTLYAHWMPAYFNVTYLLNGEQYGETESVLAGSAFAARPAPPEIPTGYKFSGWSNVPATMPANDLVIEGSYVAMVFSVTVPAVLPTTVNADGTVETAAVEIRNNSEGAVTITGVSVVPASGWTLDGTLNPATAPVDSRRFSMSVTTGNGASLVNQTVASGETLPLRYDAAIPAQSEAISDAAIASVVFTVGWAA